MINHSSTQGKQALIPFTLVNMGSKIATYILLLIYANFFLQAEFGKAKFILALFSVFAGLAFFGLPKSIVPYYISDKSKLSVVFYFYLLLIVVGMIIFSTIFFNNIYIMLLILSTPFLFLHSFFVGVYQAQHKHHLSQALSSATQYIPIFLLLIFVHLQSNGIILAIALTNFVIGVIAGFLHYQDLIFFLKLRLDISFLVKYTKYSLIISLIGYSYLFLGWIDSSILGLLSTYDNVAVYNIAGPLSNIVALVPMALSMFLLTRISTVSHNKKLSFSLLKRTLRISFFFSFIISLFLNSVIFSITKYFFPIYFLKVEVFLMMLVIGVQFFCLYHLIYYYYAGQLTPIKAFFPLLLAMIVNIVLDFLLIPEYGLFGITFATLIAHAVAFTLLSYRVGLFRMLWPVYIFVLLIPLAFYLRYYGLFLIVICIPLFYFLKLIEKEDLLVMYNTIRAFISSVPFTKK